MTSQEVAEILSQPITIGNHTISNRMVMGPMAVTAPDRNGAPTDQTVAFFEARARGGIGMIIVGGAIATSRSWDESPFRPVLRLDTDESLPGLRRMADTIHTHGVPLIAEIMPGFGRMATPGPDRPVISASPKNVVIPEGQFPDGFLVPGGRTTPMPREATIDEIEGAERELIECAERMRRAGWDGVEVAAHMSYFASSFLSPRTNWRTDRYGGSVENRARMLVNIVAGIRERLGRDFVVGLRITADDHMPDGQGPAGFAAIAREVEAAGLDYVALSSGCYETMRESAPSVDGGLIENGDAHIFRKALSVPLLLQGLHDPRNAAKAISEGHGDMVMLARQMLADPDYANKVLAGRMEDIVRCNRENICLRRLVFNMPIRCAVNPAMGRESRAGSLPPLKRFVQAPMEHAILSLTSSKRVMALAGKLMKKAS